MARKSKKDFCNNLNVRNITDNNQFWKTVKPFSLKNLAAMKKSKCNRTGQSSFKGERSSRNISSYFEIVVEYSCYRHSL